MVSENVPTSQGPVKITAVSMGNPHGVILVDSADNAPVEILGPELEHHVIWPDRGKHRVCRSSKYHRIANARVGAWQRRGQWHAAREHAPRLWHVYSIGSRSATP